MPIAPPDPKKLIEVLKSMSADLGVDGNPTPKFVDEAISLQLSVAEALPVTLIANLMVMCSTRPDIAYLSILCLGFEAGYKYRSNEVLSQSVDELIASLEGK